MSLLGTPKFFEQMKSLCTSDHRPGERLNKYHQTSSSKVRSLRLYFMSVAGLKRILVFLVVMGRGSKSVLQEISEDLLLIRFAFSHSS